MDGELEFYVEAWSDSAEHVIEIGRSLTPDDVSRPTDLPEWTVHDVFAHLAAIEAVLAGEPDPAGGQPIGTSGGRPAVISPDYTAQGVQARAGVPTAEVVAELATHVATRRQQLRDDPPDDPAAPAGRIPAGLGWDWRTLLRNRALDMWVHEQDIRRATGRPGNLDGPGAVVSVGTFAAALPYVLGKLVAPPAGTTVAWLVTGPAGFTQAIGVGDDGRAARLPAVPDTVDATIVADVETFAVLAAGRRDVASTPVEISGDADLARRVLAALRLTP